MSYQLALCFTKISILVFYLRVFPGRREIWLSWITIGIVVSYSIPFLILDALQCDPTTKASFFGSGIACVRPRYIMIVSATIHTMTDIWMVAMIIPVVWGLQIAPRQKYSLVAILSLGLFVAVASVARILSIMKANDSDPDITWIIADFDIVSLTYLFKRSCSLCHPRLSMRSSVTSTRRYSRYANFIHPHWTVIECSVGLICACAPTIRPLLLRLFPKFMASRHETLKNPYGRRTTPIGRMSGAIELRSTEVLAKSAESPGLQDGHWREDDKSEEIDDRYDGQPRNSGHTPSA